MQLSWFAEQSIGDMEGESGGGGFGFGDGGGGGGGVLGTGGDPGGGSLGGDGGAGGMNMISTAYTSLNCCPMSYKSHCERNKHNMYG